MSQTTPRTDQLDDVPVRAGIDAGLARDVDGNLLDDRLPAVPDPDAAVQRRRAGARPGVTPLSASASPSAWA